MPLLDLKRQNASLKNDLDAAWSRALQSGHFILGPEIETFEKECAQFLGVRHAISVSSGTDAILLALMSIGIGPGDEVICPSFTFFATAGCVARTGATPVFCDICPVCFGMDPTDVEKRISPATRAIIPVHLFGQTCEMDKLSALSRKHDLHIIEDAAQAFGASYRGTQAGTIGDFGAYSFFPSKNLGGFGDAGLLVTNNDVHAERARVLRVHGMKPKYFHPMIGANFRMDALQAALLRAKLPHLPAYCANRKKNADFYLSELLEIPGAALNADACLACNCGFSNDCPDARMLLPFSLPDNDHIWNQFTLRIKGGKRDAFREFLQARGIATEIYYPLPLHQQECFADIVGQLSLPHSETAAAECVSLPIFPELTRDELAEVVAAIRAFFT